MASVYHCSHLTAPDPPFLLAALHRAMKLLLQTGADPNVRDEYSTPFKVAGKKKMRLIDGMWIEALTSQLLYPSFMS